MTRIALVVSDVDGTLLTRNKVLTDGAKAAVRRLHEAGTGFTIVTSTGYATTSKFEVDANTGVLQPADSRFPDFTVPNQLLDPKFASAHPTPCTLAPPTSSNPTPTCPGGTLPLGPD